MSGSDARNDKPAADSQIGLTDMVFSGWYPQDGAYIDFPIGEQDIVLDAGCGTGSHAALAGRRGAHVIAFDILPENVLATETALRETRARETQVFQSDGNPVPLAAGLATRVICTEVLEHVDDPEQLLGELVRVAAPGALLMISCPDAVAENFFRPVAPRFYFEKPNHIRIYTHEALADLVRKFGLEILRHDRGGFYHTMRLALLWYTGGDNIEESPAIVARWDELWRMVLRSPRGKELKKGLDPLLPRTQVIIARKPA